MTAIVQATVVETPRPKRPDKWIVLGPEDGYLTLAEAESFVREMLSDGYYESFIAHIPGTRAAAEGGAHLCADCKTEPHLFGGPYCRSCERKRDADKVDAVEQWCEQGYLTKSYGDTGEWSAWKWVRDGVMKAFGYGKTREAAASAALEAIRAKGGA